MKRILVKDSVKNILKKKISYLAILLTITIGFTGLLCIFFMAQSFENGATDFYEKSNFKDIEIVASSGFTSENMAEIDSSDSVKESEGVYSAEAMLMGGVSTKSITVTSVTEKISVPTCVDGVMPVKDDECAIDEALADRMGLYVGDEVTIRLKDSELDGFLKNEKFTISATMVNPHMLSRSSANSVMVTKEAFDPEKTKDGYTNILATLNVDESDGIFSEKYLSEVSGVIKELDPRLTEIAEERSKTLREDLQQEYDDVKKEADEKLADAQKKIDDAQQELDDKVSKAKKKINDNKKKIDKNEKKLDKEIKNQTDRLNESEKKLKDSEEELNKAKKKLQSGKDALKKAKSKLNKAKKEYEEGKRQLEAMMAAPTDGMSAEQIAASTEQIEAAQIKLKKTESEIKESEKKISASEKELKANEDKINSSEKKLDESKKELADAREKLDETEKEQREKIAKARDKIEEAKLDLEEERSKAQKKVDDAQAEYDEKKADTDKELADAQRDINNLKDCNVIVQDRRMNESYEEMKSSITSLNSMGVFFSPLFALVGSVVFFSTIAIIIDEQKKQVGTLKALGFREGRIRTKYLIFGVSAAVIGAICGILLSAILEKTILKTLEDRYSFGELPVVMSPVVTSVLCVATVAIVYIVVWFACAGLLRCSAVGLISGSEPAQKTRTKARKKQRRRSLYSELILNNIKSDVARVIVGVTVIAASGLLIGAGITMKESFTEAFKLQETSVGLYDVKVVFSENSPEEIKDEVENLIKNSKADYVPAYSGGTVYETEDGGFATTMLVMDGERISEFFNIGAAAEDGVSLSDNIARAYGLGVGEKFKVFGRSLESSEVEVKKTFNYYIGNMLYMTADEYRSLFGEDCENNCYYIRFDGADGTRLTNKLGSMTSNYSGYISVETAQDETAKVESLKTLFDFVAFIFVALAAALNFLIMINLTNIQVSRRMKELLVMRVNGFSLRQVVGYLIRESLFTTIVGIVISVVGGIPFAVLLVRAISTTNITLSDAVSVVAWVISVLMSALFAFIIDAISFSRVRKVPIANITQY